ncbi:hypothetical protein PFUGPA_03705 [Plasmodium falciparum Palo Alto/Uganda]|uniref:FHA domain-containing protein n=1 Tax=Plasmodium falciparum (isolate Palo Alto / Uganda) TaxID=57270 RepID=W4IWU0_PLAFP|nr:hypothetical protein PFUGPA_03705 [Plasmodium falciparum Palo Alto/Uganda]
MTLNNLKKVNTRNTHLTTLDNNNENTKCDIININSIQKKKNNNKINTETNSRCTTYRRSVRLLLLNKEKNTNLTNNIVHSPSSDKIKNNNNNNNNNKNNKNKKTNNNIKNNNHVVFNTKGHHIIKTSENEQSNKTILKGSNEKLSIIRNNGHITNFVKKKNDQDYSTKLKTCSKSIDKKKRNDEKEKKDIEEIIVDNNRNNKNVKKKNDIDQIYLNNEDIKKIDDEYLFLQRKFKKQKTDNAVLSKKKKSKMFNKMVKEYIKQNMENNIYVADNKFNLYSYGTGNALYTLERINYNNDKTNEDHTRKLNVISEIIDVKKQKFIIGSSYRKCDLVIKGNIENEHCELICRCIEKNINRTNDKNRQINKYNLFIINKSSNNSSVFLNDIPVDIDQVKDDDYIYLGMDEKNNKNTAKYIYKIKYNKLANIFNVNNMNNLNPNKENSLKHLSKITEKVGTTSKILSNNFVLSNQITTIKNTQIQQQQQLLLKIQQIKEEEEEEKEKEKKEEEEEEEKKKKKEELELELEIGEKHEEKKEKFKEKEESDISIVLFLIIPKKKEHINEPIYYINNFNTLTNTLNSTPKKFLDNTKTPGKNISSVNKTIKEDSPNTRFNESIKKINRICQSRISPLGIKDSIKKDEKNKGVLKSSSNSKELPVTLLNACVELCKEINRSITKENNKMNSSFPKSTPILNHSNLTPSNGLSYFNKNEENVNEQIDKEHKKNEKMELANIYNTFNTNFHSSNTPRVDNKKGEYLQMESHNNMNVHVDEEIQYTSKKGNNLCEDAEEKINKDQSTLEVPKNLEYKQKEEQNNIKNQTDCTKHNETLLNKDIEEIEKIKANEDTENNNNNNNNNNNCKNNLDEVIIINRNNELKGDTINIHEKYTTEMYHFNSKSNYDELYLKEKNCINNEFQDNLLVTPKKNDMFLNINNNMEYYDCKEEKVFNIVHHNNNDDIVKTSDTNDNLRKEAEKNLYSLLYSKNYDDLLSNHDYVICLKNYEGIEQYVKVIGQIKVKRNAFFTDIKHEIDLKMLDNIIEIKTLDKINYFNTNNISNPKYSIHLNAFTDKIDENKFHELSALHLDYIDHTNFSHMYTSDSFELKKMLFVKYYEN